MGRYLTYEGRVGRLHYLLWLLALAVPLGIANGICNAMEAYGIGLLISLAGAFLASFAAVQRLHDLDRPGTHYWLLLIPLFNIYLGLVLLFQKGSSESNRFGPDPTGGSPSSPTAVLKPDDGVLYGQAYEELEDGSMDKTVWAKAFTDENGNEARAKALYIKRRVATLTEQKRQKERDDAAVHQATHKRERAERLAALSTNDAFKLLRQDTDGKAQTFAELRGDVWVCICGTENFYVPEKSIQNCSTCHTNRDFALSHWSEEAMKEKLLGAEQSPSPYR